MRLGADAGETWTRTERWREGPGTETEQSKDMETQGERWSQGGKPNARETGGGGRNQAMGERFKREEICVYLWLSHIEV